MLTRLYIKNFQSHSDRVIDFDPHITVIIGRNDVGKSALLRALSWLAFNRPAGDEFIRWGEKTATVELTVDGHTITRTKGKENSYRLDNGEPYKALGQGVVPEVIANVLNLGPVNFSNQLDPPFWFCETAGEVSRQLNSIVDLGVIDDVLAGAAAKVRSAQSDISLTEQRLAQAEERAKALDYIVDLNSNLSALEALEAEQAETALVASRMRRDIEDGKRLALDHRNACNTVLGAATAIELGERLVELVQERKELEKLLSEYKRMQEQEWESQSDIQEAETILATATKGQRCPLCRSAITL